jgi:threonyl-tRNA synthetase
MIYSSKLRSYRELPIRLTEFGTVYRHEQSGELNGLIRARGFTQDDSHIYCRPDQLVDEICDAIDLTKFVFATLGFDDIEIRLSLHDPENPEKYGGTENVWQQAEQDVREAADRMGISYIIGVGEASINGPKIDFIVRDARGRKWQLGTVQVDYVMPERFDLSYIGSDGQPHRPVIIHRAPFGSMERFIGVLIEHTAGNFPLWLAPVQVAVLPITEDVHDYASTVHQALIEKAIRAELDLRSEKIGKKIREAEVGKIPYMVIIGQKEADSGEISLRRHRKGDQGNLTIEHLLQKLITEIKEKS